MPVSTEQKRVISFFISYSATLFESSEYRASRHKENIDEGKKESPAEKHTGDE
jgi:hypothetical protein